MNYKTTISALKNNKNVVAAILFGSRAKGTTQKKSDYDIAVFLKKTDRQSTKDIEMLKTEKFDIIPSNKLPFHVKVEAFKHGKPIFITDNDEYTLELYHNIKEYQDNLHHYHLLRKYRCINESSI